MTTQPKRRMSALRGSRLVVLVAVLLASAAGVAYATAQDTGTSSVLQACENPGNGNLRLVANNQTDCHGAETAVAWNVQGPAGAPGAQGEPGEPGRDGIDGKDGSDGTSPTVQQLAAGDANCSAGGAAITDASGSTAYVCSGEQGPAGTFNGSFASPDGTYSISVTNGGITLKDALLGSSVTVTHGQVDVEGVSTKVQAESTLELLGVVTKVGGGGTCKPAAGVGDVTGGGAPGAPQTIVTGSINVLIC
jgi:hypothetical protein